MKKIVLITECLEKGVGKHILDLYINLKKEDIYIYILCGKKRVDLEILKKFSKEDYEQLECLKENIGINDLKSIFEIVKILKKIKPDIVHCHSSKAGLVGRIAAKFVGIDKIIYSPHAYFFLKYKDKSIKQKIFIIAEKILSRFFTDKTITTSIGEDKAFKKYNIDKNEKKCLIKHGIEIIEYTEEQRKINRKKLGVLESDILIGSMARFEEQKDPITTLKIMQKVIQKNKNVKCIFWGKGSLFNQVYEYNRENGNWIMLPGETTTPEININAVDIYLTASRYEGLPYTLLMALGQGKAIVASNVEGNNDCVEVGTNGAVFDVQAVDEAEQLISKIIIENDIERMGVASKKIFQKNFSIDMMMKKYYELYEENK